MALALIDPHADLDLRDVVLDLVHTGRIWSKPLPADLADHSTHRRRVRGAAFSALVMLDGDSGAGAVRLSPQSHPDVDLGGLALHEVADTDPALLDDPHQRQLMGRLQRVVTAHADRPGPIEQVIGRFLVAWCCVIAQHYQLRLIDTDPDTGEYQATRGDLAPALPAAVAAEWDRLERQRTAALTALAESAELREHGTRLLLAALGPRGDRRG